MAMGSNKAKRSKSASNALNNSMGTNLSSAKLIWETNLITPEQTGQSLGQKPGLTDWDAKLGSKEED